MRVTTCVPGTMECRFDFDNVCYTDWEFFEDFVCGWV